MTRFAGGPRISNFLEDGIDFSSLGSRGVMNSAADEANAAMNNARAEGIKMRSIAQVESAKNYADATRAAGAAQGQASMVSGIAGAVGGLGGLFRGGGGGSSFGGGSSWTPTGGWDNFGSVRF